HAGLGGAAVVVVGGEAGAEVVLAGEQVVHVGGAEAGAVGAAHQQRVERTPFQAGAPGELARILVGVAVAVVTAGEARLQRGQQRQAQLARRAPAVAVAAAVAIARAVVGVFGQRQRVGVDLVGLAAVFQRAGEAGIAGRHREQGRRGGGEAEVVVLRFGLPGRHRRDRIELLRRQRAEQAFGIRVVDRIAIVVVAQALAEEQAVRGGGADARHLHLRLVLRVVVRRLPVPVFAQRAGQAGGEGEGLLGGGVHAVAQAARFLGRELARPDLVGAGAGVVEHLVAVVA